MFNERIEKVYLYRRVLWDMAISQLKSKYAGSQLGIWWAVVTPLILTGSISLVFGLIFKINMPKYSIFVLSGIIPWLFFNNALMEVTNSFIVNRSILRQAIFPKELVPIASVLGNLLNFLLGLAFLMPIFIISSYKIILPLHYLIIITGFFFIFVSGVGLIFACLNVFFRDLAYLLAAVFTIWFWMTPVFYSVKMIPDSFKWAYFINPVTYFITAYQCILFEAKAPSLLDISLLLIISSFFFLTGYMLFINKESSLLKSI